MRLQRTLLIIVTGALLSGCAAEWVDDTHHWMIHDSETKLMALEELCRWDRAEILSLRERVTLIEWWAR